MVEERQKPFAATIRNIKAQGAISAPHIPVLQLKKTAENSPFPVSWSYISCTSARAHRQELVQIKSTE
jgi:hypothetical protein